jgi:predicted O-linked N-acetylglucosamine transferase (SPINDLY family)
MPELIASTVGDYEARALHLATHPQALQILRTQVQAHVTSKFLFDTKAFCFGLEATFIAMWRMAQLGKSQDDLSKPMARDRSA